MIINIFLFILSLSKLPLNPSIFEFWLDLGSQRVDISFSKYEYPRPKFAKSGRKSQLV